MDEIPILGLRGRDSALCDLCRLREEGGLYDPAASATARSKYAGGHTHQNREAGFFQAGFARAAPPRARWGIRRDSL